MITEFYPPRSVAYIRSVNQSLAVFDQVSSTQSEVESTHIGQDRQALLKAKYCPPVAAVSCTKTPCDLYF